TPRTLVNDVLVGGGCFDIVPGSIASIGNENGIGYFEGGENSIGISEGVILATGDISNAQGPNRFDATSGYLGSNGEIDLERLLPGASIRDVSGLEFSFTPTTDKVEFRYVFASEEYCEFAGTRFNDVFGFFIQGAGINGGFTGNGTNIALIPGTNERVSINSVNHVVNRNYYIKNETFEDAIDCLIPYGPQALNDIEYDGFTVVLTASVEVVPCETYTIKLVVADVSDGRLDSAVFLEANSFEAGGAAEVSTDVPYNRFNLAYESCQSSFFRFDRVDEDVSEPLLIKYKLSDMSTAEVGVDFAPFPDSIVIPAGATEFLLPVEIFEDDVVEGQESIVIELENPCSCETPFTLMHVIDKPAFSALGVDEVICKEDSTDLSIALTGGVAPYTYAWSTGDSLEVLRVAPSENSNYEVVVTDFCDEVVTETIAVQVLEEPSASLSGAGQICPESPSAGMAVALDGSGPFTLTYAIDGVEQPPVNNIDNNTFTLTGDQAGIYTLVAMADNGCPG
ncbi:MAG: choice-of-anchor L domain-containing protein, partial [Bacteroidota bacterium]